MIIMNKEFASRLKMLRTEKDLLQKDIANLLGTTDNAVGNYERGTRVPDYDSLKKLAVFFDVSIDYLLGHSDMRKIETETYHSADLSGLPEEAVKQVEDYIEFIKQKYNQDGSLKEKD